MVLKMYKGIFALVSLACILLAGNYSFSFSWPVCLIWPVKFFFFFEKNVELVISKNRWTWKRDVFSLYKTISWGKVSLWMSNFFSGHPQCNLDFQTVIKFIPTLMLRRNIFTGLFQRQTLLDSRVRCLVWVCASK